MMRFFSVMLLVVAGAATSAAATWNATGHYFISLIAWEQMDEAARTAAVAILRHHPRFQEDFQEQMPLRVLDADPATRDKWIFLHASTWPDIVRDLKGRDARYNHPSWHYVNEPLYLSEEDRAAIGDPRGVNRSADWSPDLPKEAWALMNVVQALKECQHRLKTSTDDEDRAIQLCWLLHLVGDLHQPLHSTALFTRVRFKKGDRGGNDIPLDGQRNLHAYWDALLGRSRWLPGLERRRQRYLLDPALQQRGRRAAEELTIEAWRDESHQIARDFVYTDVVLDPVGAKDKVKGDLPELRIPADYEEVAREIALERAVEAGYRIAAVTSACLQ